jgi:hypothetical protein
MPTNTSVASYDVYTYHATPDMNYGTWTNLQVSGGSGMQSYSYLYFAGMPPHGASVASATLTVYLRDASTWTGGPYTLTANRVNDSWSESKLTWNRSNSDQLGASAHAATATVAANSTDGTAVTFDVSGILSDIASGTSWYGLRLGITGDSSGTLRKVYGAETTAAPQFRPTLEIDWSIAPEAPSGLTPAGGQAVSVQLPTVSWNFKDQEGDGQAQLQVQTCLDNTFGAVEFDSGWVVSGESQLDLSTTSYAGLSFGDTKFWRVRVKDTNGLTSPWSSVASFTRMSKGTLVLSNPPDGGTVEETTPPITTTLTGRNQTGIAYTLSVANSDGTWKEVWTVGRFAAAATSGTAFTFNLPKGLLTKTGIDYRLEVWSYDGVDRVATPGDSVSVKATAIFQFTRASQSPVTNLTVTGNGPGIEIAFQRSSEPDFFALTIDDEIIYDRLVTSDYLTSAGHYAITYYGLPANSQHKVSVEAVVNNAGVMQHSGTNPSVTATPFVSGIWLVDNAGAPFATGSLPRMVKIEGQESQSMAIGESSNIYYPVGRRDPVTVTDSIRGMEGTITGSMQDDANGYLDAFRWMKQPEQAGRIIRLIYDTVNIEVNLGAAQLTPEPYGEPTFDVSIDIVQVGTWDGGIV